MRQFQCVPTTYVTENKKKYLEINIYTKYRYPLSFRLLNKANCQSVLKTMSLI